MNVTVQAAIISAIVAFFAALLTALVSYFRERSEKEKWRRTLELEERRVKNEEYKWTLELNNQREIEVHKVRLRAYPEVFGALTKLSSYNLGQFDEKLAQELADKFTEWGYGEAGLCMLPDTRDALFALRQILIGFLDKNISKEEAIHLLSGTQSIRIDLIELMRRDFNHEWSQWRNIKPLIDMNREKYQTLFGGSKESAG
jgi:hypothetical protein